jgi:hypothetical protein
VVALDSVLWSAEHFSKLLTWPVRKELRLMQVVIMIFVEMQRISGMSDM